MLDSNLGSLRHQMVSLCIQRHWMNISVDFGPGRCICNVKAHMKDIFLVHFLSNYRQTGLTSVKCNWQDDWNPEMCFDFNTANSYNGFWGKYQYALTCNDPYSYLFTVQACIDLILTRLLTNSTLVKIHNKRIAEVMWMSILKPIYISHKWTNISCTNQQFPME